jgi:glycosyltransferase involved in cell wall biosynthesis
LRAVIKPGNRIACVTRIAVERDKRTYQTAASLSRLGYQTVVVEGEPSRLPREELPFELITVSGAEAIQDPGDTGARTKDGGADRPQAHQGRSHPLVEALPRPVGSVASSVGRFLLRARQAAGFDLRRWFRRDNEQTLDSLPAADLYYLTFFWQFPAVWETCRRTGARYVYDANDAYWAWPGYQWYPLPFRRFLRRVERRCVRRAAAFITVSDGLADMLERRYGRRPTVVRNAHDLRIDREASIDVRQAAGVGAEDFVLVIAGNEKPSDAVAAPLRALAVLPESIHLVLLGRGYEKHQPEITELGLANRVHLVPPVSPAEVTSAIRSADASIINTRASGVHLHSLPTRLFSAVAAGLPVLYPPLPGVRALAETHGLGVPVDADDPESIAAAVRDLNDSPDLAAETRANVERAREVLNWEREEGLIAEIIQDALSRED